MPTVNRTRLRESQVAKWAPETASTIKALARPPGLPLHHTPPLLRAPPHPIGMDAAGGGGAVVVGGGLDDADAVFFSRRGHRCCGCFWAPAPWASSSSSPHARRRPTGAANEEWWHGVGEEAGSGGRRRRWWRRGVDALMKVREWSELVAGPRWKTFIRRFRFRGGGLRHGGASNGGGGKLNYDPLSYALNFDEGHGGGSGSPGEGDDDYQGYRDFSTRFVAPPPGSVRSSMDLGGRDAPPPLVFQHHSHSPRSPATAAARG